MVGRLAHSWPRSWRWGRPSLGRPPRRPAPPTRWPGAAGGVRPGARPRQPVPSGGCSRPDDDLRVRCLFDATGEPEHWVVPRRRELRAHRRLGSRRWGAGGRAPAGAVDGRARCRDLRHRRRGRRGDAHHRRRRPGTRDARRRRAVGRGRAARRRGCRWGHDGGGLRGSMARGRGRWWRRHRRRRRAAGGSGSAVRPGPRASGRTGSASAPGSTRSRRWVTAGSASSTTSSTGTGRRRWSCSGLRYGRPGRRGAPPLHGGVQRAGHRVHRRGRAAPGSGTGDVRRHRPRRRALRRCALRHHGGRVGGLRQRDGRVVPAGVATDDEFSTNTASTPAPAAVETARRPAAQRPGAAPVRTAQVAASVRPRTPSLR